MSAKNLVKNKSFTIKKNTNEPVDLPSEEESSEIFRINWNKLSGTPSEGKVYIKNKILSNLKKNKFTSSIIPDDLNIRSPKLEVYFKSFINNLIDNVAKKENYISKKDHRVWKEKLKKIRDIKSDKK